MADAPEALWMALDAIAYEEDPAAFKAPNDEQRAWARKHYSDQQLLDLSDALAWAIAHPDHDFAKQFGKQVPPIEHDKPTIVGYFKKLHEGLEPLVREIRAKHP